MTENKNRWPDGVVAALRSRGHSDEEIDAMDPRTAFAEFCQWNGLLGWGEPLWKIAHELEVNKHTLEMLEALVIAESALAIASSYVNMEQKLMNHTLAIVRTVITKAEGTP